MFAQPSSTGWPVIHGHLFLVPCTKWRTLDKSLYVSTRKTRPCFTGHPVPLPLGWLDWGGVEGRAGQEPPPLGRGLGGRGPPPASSRPPGTASLTCCVAFLQKPGSNGFFVVVVYHCSISNVMISLGILKNFSIASFTLLECYKHNRCSMEAIQLLPHIVGLANFDSLW